MRISTICLYLSIIIASFACTPAEVSVRTETSNDEPAIGEKPKPTPTPKPTPIPEVKKRELAIELIAPDEKVYELDDFDVKAYSPKEDKSVEDVTDKVTWSVSDASLAVRSGTDLPVTYSAKTIGKVTVTAKAAGFEDATLEINILELHAASIEVVGPASVKVGECKRFEITGQNPKKGKASLMAETTFSVNSAVASLLYSDESCANSLGVLKISGDSKVIYFKTTSNQDVSLDFNASGIESEAFHIEVLDENANSLKLTKTAGTAARVDDCIAFSVAVQDKFNNVIQSLAQPVNGNFLTNNGGKFYSNSNCSNATSTFTLEANNTSKIYYFKTAAAGSNIINASPAGIVSGTLSLNVGPGELANIEIVMPSSMDILICTAVTINGRDKYGNPTTAGQDAILKVTTSSTLKSMQTGCGSDLGSVNLKGKSTYSFSILGSIKNLNTIRFEIETLGIDINKSIAVAKPAAEIVIDRTPLYANEDLSKILTDKCVQLGVGVNSSDHQPTLIGEDLTVTIQSSLEGETYANQSCSGDKLLGNKITLSASSQSKKYFSFIPKVSGEYKLKATAPGLNSPELILQTATGPTNASYDGPANVAMNQCVGPFTATLTNEAGDPVVAPDALILTAQSNAADKVSFHSGPNCGDTTTGNFTSTISAGETQIDFYAYYKDDACSGSCAQHSVSQFLTIRIFGITLSSSKQVVYDD